MKLVRVRKLKSWTYLYKTLAEKEEHKQNMLLGKFNIEKEGELWIEFSQVIKESG